MREEFEEEREVVTVMKEEDEEDASSGEVRWENFLPKGSLKVLLVEGDDSTRQIIAALLRKCNYKVSAVADGKKAWELMKERPHSIDVVLSEVEVPSLSGISLLTLIMDHESCKNVPVIMMSSHDSINMVFKCMLKGAVDFLVKPIRKNELRNLWQHVWRRYTLTDSHGGTNVYPCDSQAKQKHEDISLRVNQLNGFVPSIQQNKECSEKGSDAESSCTRSEMEAESTYKENSREPQQPKCRNFSLSDGTICQNNREQNQPNRTLVARKDKAEGKLIMFGSLVTPNYATCMSSEQVVGDGDSKPRELCDINEMENQNCDHEAPQRQVINFIGRIDDQREYSFEGTRNGVADYSEAFKASYIPMLELSLRRSTSVDREEKNECSTLNHSDSSAFSFYTGRTPASPSLRTANVHAGLENYSSYSTKQIPDKGSGHFNSVPRCNATYEHLNKDDAESLNLGAPNKDGGVIKCSPVRVIPATFPVGGINFFDREGFGTATQPVILSHSSASPLWSTTSPMGHESFHTNTSHQSDTRDYCSSQNRQSHNRPPKSPITTPAQIEDVSMELRDELQHNVSSSSALGNISSINNGNFSMETVALATDEGKHQAELHQLNAREAALNKFRLKRKDRCFEKKVRYQSRKRLAEQRPRVKGQFVRHAQPEAHSTEADSYQVEPAAG